MTFNSQRPGLRESISVLCALVVVVSFMAIGFVQVAVHVATGEAIEFPDSWQSAMLSLASAALGFLIGKDNNNGQTIVNPPSSTVTETKTISSPAGAPVATGAQTGVPTTIPIDPNTDSVTVTQGQDK